MPDPIAVQDRAVPLEGCFNVRDAGGYAGAGGRTVRWRRLYRGGGPQSATATDWETLRRLSIACVIDLRTHDEVRERGTFAFLGARDLVHHLPMVDALPSDVELARWTDAVYIGDHYFTMLMNAPDAIAEALSILTDPSAYPALIHCSAGKDRTGVLTTVILGLLGVDDATIARDYAMSADAMAEMLAYYQRMAPDAQARLQKFRPAILAAEPAAMARFVALLRSTYGSFDAYASSVGAGAAVPRLRDALLS